MTPASGGYVTKTDNGGFKGAIDMTSLRNRIERVPNRSKEIDHQPDFRGHMKDRVEIGGGWNKVGQRSGKSPSSHHTGLRS